MHDDFLSRISKYRIMWVFVLFDLPTETKKQRRAAALFRKELLSDGFSMFQFSIYIRSCASRENAAVHTKRIKYLLPAYGKVGIFTITDKQFERMELFHSTEKTQSPTPPGQLTLF